MCISLCLLLCKPLGRETRQTHFKSHSDKAQENKAAWFKQPFGWDSSSQSVFPGTPGAHGGTQAPTPLGAASVSHASCPFLTHHHLSLICFFSRGSVKETWLGKQFSRLEGGKKIKRRRRIWKLTSWCCHHEGWDLKEVMWGSLVGCQGFWCFQMTPLNERGSGALGTRCKWGCCQASPAARFQPDGLTGQSPLLVSNATLHSGQLPIRKTAEAQRAGRNEHVTHTALPGVKET